MKVFVTKYALSGKGKIPLKDFEPSNSDPNYLYDPAERWGSYRLGKDCFKTEADAVAEVEARRTKKIASLKKQIAKLEKLSFQTLTSAHQQETQS